MTTEQNDSSNQEWQQLQDEWQNYQPDIAKIKKRIAWLTWRMIAILVIDVLAVIGYLPFLFLVVFTEESTVAMKVWHFAMLPLLAYGVYWDFKLRLPLFKLESESAMDILKFYLDRVRAGIKIGDIGFKFSLSLVVLFVIWVATSFFVDMGEEKLQQPSFIIFGISWMVLFAGIMHWYRNRKTKELERLKALWQDFLSD
jgi:hypothetical protein